MKLLSLKLHSVLLKERGLSKTEVPGLCYLIENGTALKEVNLQANSFSENDIEELLKSASKSRIERLDVT